MLGHPSEEIRCIAVRVLTFHWDIKRHRDEIIHLLRRDPGHDVRGFTAAGLGFVFRHSRDPVVSHALIDRIRDGDEDPYLRKSAYGALHNVWSPPNVTEDLADTKAETWQMQRARELQAARTHEEFQRKQWMWREGEKTLWKIDWEFVERIDD